MVLEFKWDSNFEASEYTPNGKTLLIKGTLVDTSVNANNWSIPEEEFDSLVKQIPGSQLRIDHGKSVRDIVGGFTKAERDTKNKTITFEAEVDDPEIIQKILKKRVGFVSEGGEADAFCSVCGKPTRPIRGCKCEKSHEVIRNIKHKEASIISEPAYKNTSFTPVSFIAALEKVLVQEVAPEVKDDKVLSGKETSVDDTQKLTATKKDEVEGSSGKIEGEKEIMSTKEELKVPAEIKKEDTHLEPAGPNAGILVAKMEEMAKKMEEMCKKMEKRDEEDEARRKKDDEEEAKVKKEEDERKKKDEDEAKVKKAPEAEPDADDVPQKKVKGAKVDKSQDIEASAVTAEAGVPAWYAELRAAAKKYEII